MKRSMFILTGVAVLAAGAYFGSYLFAQLPAGGTGTAQANTGTRIAVINVGHVFHNYKRAVAFKAEIDELLRQPKAAATQLIEQGRGFEAQIKQPGISPADKQKLEISLLNVKRKLEDLDMEMRKLIGKRQEDNLMTLWKEVNMGIQQVAKAYGFQIVLGYGDPMEQKDLDLFPNINRKMMAMDLGSTVPLYIHGSVDLSDIVTVTLNRWIDSATPKVQGTPTSGQK